MTIRRLAAYTAFVLFLAVSCDKENTAASGLSRNAFLNFFAKSLTETYYLWLDDVREQVDSWKTEEDPVAKVLQMRYKDASGRDIDRWTVMLDDYASMIGSVSGVTTTYGYNLIFYYTDETRYDINAVVRYVYDGSPSQKAGLKRGDRIRCVNGTPLNESNYKSLSSVMYDSPSCVLTMNDGREVLLEAVEMDVDPFLVCRIFEGGGKKVGYLFYTSFSMNSLPLLTRMASYFRDGGVSELILDLRYNGGGYVETEEAVASLLAPEKNVAAGDVYQTMVSNGKLSNPVSEIPFRTSFSYRDADGITGSVSTEGYNLGLSRIYAIMTGSSASASEALVACLQPYIEVEVIGQKSLGKYCSGYIFSAPDFFKSRQRLFSKEDYRRALSLTDNWGMYIMYARFGDRNGDCPCMPDGIVPDTQASDNPVDGFQLGDADETMLSIALEQAGVRTRTKAGFDAPSPLACPPLVDEPAFSILQTP